MNWKEPTSQEGPRMDRDEELISLMRRIALRARADGLEMAQQVGLTHSELRVLIQLVSHGPRSLRDFVSDLPVPRSTMTEIADRLVEKGLARRQAVLGNRRHVELQATDAASFVLHQSTVGLADLAAALLEGLSETEQDELVRLLGRAAQGL